EAEIVEWHIKEGDKVSEDQHILDVMTDKATVEIPCAVNGVVKKIVGSPGDVIPVGTEILVIEIDGSPPTEEEAPAPEVKEEKPAADPGKDKALAEGPDRTAEKSEDPAGGKQAVPPAKPAAPKTAASSAPARASGERPLAS
ncbi:MAG TPA: branched-chain alpha-keto acid dehydrogenase subunit E2, partial [Oceanicaulis sp.]|nr:branched-chain alpha-keto acid dehydrogenase subunit E2 [Oceanicaulis sp.]